MTVESRKDIDGILSAGRVVACVRDTMLSEVEPGMTTAELDKLGGELLDRLGAKSAPRSIYNFPGATCISINEEAARGIPGRRVIQAGDIVNVDVSAELDGYFADTGSTIVVPPVTCCLHFSFIRINARFMAFSGHMQKNMLLFFLADRINCICLDHEHHRFVWCAGAMHNTF